MAIRNKLHRNRLSHFIDWLNKHEFEIRTTNLGDWQVLGVFYERNWQFVYDNLRTEHLSYPNKLDSLVSYYIKEYKNEINKG